MFKFFVILAITRESTFTETVVKIQNHTNDYGALLKVLLPINFTKPAETCEILCTSIPGIIMCDTVNDCNKSCENE